MRFRGFGFLLIFASVVTHAQNISHTTYRLFEQKIANDTYLVPGVTEHFNTANGGNILNTSFIITDKGVVVIDTGPSALYGRELRALIESITAKPIVQVYITHHHPDHFLGNQAFADAPIAGLPATISAAHEQGDDFSNAMYFMLGRWMKGTELVFPGTAVSNETVDYGSHQLRLIELSGHSQGDLAILDETTGVLFAGDLVFHNRAPTTPQADLPQWFESLDKLEQLTFNLLVPGHGPIASDNASIMQTRGYLKWLDATLRGSANQGLDMLEVSRLPIPDEFKTLAVQPAEFQRSVSHLYPQYEAQSLPAID